MPSGTLVSFERLILNNQNINSHPQLASRLGDYLGAVSDDGYVPASDILDAIYELAPSDADAEAILMELIDQLQAEGIVLSILSDGGGDTATLSIEENTLSVTTVFALDPDDDAVTYNIVGGADASLFEIDASTGALSFINAQDFEAWSDADTNGTYEVVVQASDTNSNQIDTQTISVVLANVNEAPMLSPATTILTEDDAAISVDLRSHASDPDAGDDPDTFQFAVVGASPETDIVSIQDGVLFFDPGSDFQYLGASETTTVDLQIEVADDGGARSQAQYSFQINGVNDTPLVAAPLSLVVNEEGALSQIDLLSGASDIDVSDTLSISGLALISGNAVGVTIDESTLLVDPGAYHDLTEGEFETISFAYLIADGNGGSAAQTIDITVVGSGSDDPIFVTDYERLLSWDATGFDANRVYHPTVIANDDGSIEMFYAGLGNANINDMGYARSEDGVSFSRVVENPVIDASIDNPPWASWLARPVSAFKIDGEFVIYFGGDNSNLQSDSQNQEGWTRATSLDGINWSILADPIRIDIGPRQGARLKEVVQTEEGFIAFWLDINPDGNNVSMVATSADGVTFADDQAANYGSYLLESSTFYNGEVLGVFRSQTDNNGANTFLLGRSFDGIEFTFGEEITTDKSIAVNDLVVKEGGTVEVYGAYNEGNINWNFGNLVIERFEVGLSAFGEPLTPPEQTLSIIETFDDGALNTEGWSYMFEDNVSELNGTLNLEILATDVRSRATIDFGESLTDMTMSYDAKMHSANDHFYGEHTWSFTNAANEDFVIRFQPQSTAYGPSYENDPNQFDKPKISLIDPSGTKVSVFSDGAATSSFFDEWTEISFGFDGETGTVTVDMESDGIVDMALTDSILLGATAESYTFGTYGWFTGHSSEFDNLEIAGTYNSQEDTMFG